MGKFYTSNSIFRASAGYGLSLLAAVCLTFMATGTATAGDTIYVSLQGNNSDGTSWTNAYTSLQHAIYKAQTNDTIWVKTGTYKPDSTARNYGTSSYDHTANDGSDKAFILKDSVAIYGGFAGGESSLSQRNWKTNVTTLSGKFGSGNTAADSAHHVVIGSGLTNSTVLDGFVIQDGRTYPTYGAGTILVHSNPVDSARGGGIYLVNSSPILKNLIIKNNTAHNGAGIYLDDSSPSLTNVCIHTNYANLNAGAFIFKTSSGSNPTLTNVTVANNHEYDSSAGTGGIFIGSGNSPIINNSIIWGNTDANSANNVSAFGTPYYTTSLVEGTSAGDNPLNSDFTLKYGSSNIPNPAVNSGTDAANSEPKDLGCNARIYETIDLGAYESNFGQDSVRVNDTIDYVNEVIRLTGAGNYYVLTGTGSTPTDTVRVNGVAQTFSGTFSLTDTLNIISSAIDLWLVKIGTANVSYNSLSKRFSVSARPSAPPSAPTGVDTVEVSDLQTQKGGLKGVAAGMEYRNSTSTTWTAITSSSNVTGLDTGLYIVRYAAVPGTAFASDTVMLRIYPKGTASTWGFSFTPYINYLTETIDSLRNDRYYKVEELLSNGTWTERWKDSAINITNFVGKLPLATAKVPVGTTDKTIRFSVLGPGSDKYYISTILTIKAATKASEWEVSPYSSHLNSGIADTVVYTGLAYSYDIMPKTQYLAGYLDDYYQNGVVTVKYNGSTTAPKAVGKYELSFDLAATAQHPAASNIVMGTFYICYEGMYLAIVNSSNTDVNAIDWGTISKANYTVAATETSSGTYDVRPQKISFLNWGDTIVPKLNASLAGGSNSGFSLQFMASSALTTSTGVNIQIGAGDSLLVSPKKSLADGIYLDTIIVRSGTTELKRIPIAVKVETGTSAKITIPVIPNAAVVPAPGTYYYANGSTVTFTVTPNAGYSLDGMKFGTGNTELDKNMTVTHNANGTVTVKITKVSGNFTIITANEDIAGDAIWTEGSTLYIRTAKPSPLTIYTVTGSTHTRQTLPAGETSFTLPRGLYIINVGSTVRKAVVK
ncbi:MAG: right-handed parallel beta-helix repeat-containing protein [Tannerella sp.]|nr:right-handed parallel beta-helix repeat-containing protein [Tannerella sp.]